MIEVPDFHCLQSSIRRSRHVKDFKTRLVSCQLNHVLSCCIQCLCGIVRVFCDSVNISNRICLQTGLAMRVACRKAFLEHLRRDTQWRDLFGPFVDAEAPKTSSGSLSNFKRLMWQCQNLDFYRAVLFGSNGTLPSCCRLFWEAVVFRVFGVLGV